MEQCQPILGVPTSQQPLEGLLRPPGQRPVTFLKPALVLAQESVSMVHQNAPQRALMDLLAPVANALAGLRTFHPLTLNGNLCRPATGRLVTQQPADPPPHSTSIGPRDLHRHRDDPGPQFTPTGINANYADQILALQIGREPSSTGEQLCNCRAVVPQEFAYPIMGAGENPHRA